MEEHYNETEHLVFEDFQLKVYNDSDTSSSVSLDDEEYVVDSDCYIIEQIYNTLKDFVMFNYIGLFDEMKLSDIMSLIEEFQNTIDINSDIHIPSHKFFDKKYPTLEMWLIHYADEIRKIYNVFINECIKYNFDFGTLEKFTIFGFENSSSTIILT